MRYIRTAFTFYGKTGSLMAVGEGVEARAPNQAKAFCQGSSQGSGSSQSQQRA